MSVYCHNLLGLIEGLACDDRGLTINGGLPAVLIHDHLELSTDGTSQEPRENDVANDHRYALPDDNPNSTPSILLEHQSIPLLIVYCQQGEDQGMVEGAEGYLMRLAIRWIQVAIGVD